VPRWLGFDVKCDQCDNEATVHEWTKKAGQKVEKHLCEECARKQGVAIQPQQQISQLITQLIGNAKPGTPAAAINPTIQVGACATCGTTYAQFRHSGLLGCPACYAVFEAQLGPLLQRAHEGGTHHTGKTPSTATACAAPPPEKTKVQADAMMREREDRLKRLREQLAEAVAAEQYERAATIRDELSALECTGGSGGIGGSGEGGGTRQQAPSQGARPSQ
jgi:protein arginine kinase activator